MLKYIIGFVAAAVFLLAVFTLGPAFFLASFLISLLTKFGLPILIAGVVVALVIWIRKKIRSTNN